MSYYTDSEFPGCTFRILDTKDPFIKLEVTEKDGSSTFAWVKKDSFNLQPVTACDTSYDWYWDKYQQDKQDQRESGYAPTNCSIGKHVFPDTGLLKSWCKHCDVQGEFNRETGRYEVVSSFKKEGAK